jgi:hypothetical protein
MTSPLANFAFHIRHSTGDGEATHYAAQHRQRDGAFPSLFDGIERN